MQRTRKEQIVASATHLFAIQGYDATTTLQIAVEAGINEPLIFYHFKNKEQLFIHIVGEAFNLYFSYLQNERGSTSNSIDRLINLINIHLDIIHSIPEAMLMVIGSCPAKLVDADSVCAQNYKKGRHLLNEIVSGLIQDGVDSGEFHTVPVALTANLLIALLNGLLRQRAIGKADDRGIRQVAAEFCRRSLLKRHN